MQQEVPQAETDSWERRFVYFVEDVDANPAQRRLFEIKGEREGNVHMVFWAPDSKGVLAIRTSLESMKLVRFDIRTGNESTLLNSKWGLFHPTMSLNGRYLYTTREKPDVPKQLCRIDLGTGEMLPIDNFNQQLNDIQVPAYIPVRQTNRYGDELTGYLFLPPNFHGQYRLPFVAIRGQPWDGFCDGGTGVEFPGLVMALKGYAVLFFEPGTKHFGDSHDGNGDWSLLRFQSPIENLTLVIRDLSKKGWIDPQKAGLAGLSYGADLVDYASGFSNTFAVGSATTAEGEAPANYFILGQDGVEMFEKRWGLPYPDIKGLPAWQKVSASLNASHSKMPLLFQPPDSEAWAGIAHRVAWEHAGLPVDMYVYPDEGHVKIHPLNRYYVMTRNLQWFDYWLRGAIDPRPEFADQFRRWAGMRDRWLESMTPSAQGVDSLARLNARKH